MIVAKWELSRDPLADAASEAAQALEDAGLLQSPETAAETARLRARLVELEQVASSETYPPALPWASLMDAEDQADFLDELAASAILHANSATALAEVEATCGRWRVIAEAQHAHNTAPGPDADVLPEPYGCQHCGIPERVHARQWTPDSGWHAWARPTDKQIVARMLARRAVHEAEAKAGGTSV
ncbi:hypothetical protein [Streptomyces triculaminicus]|uniref:hypothetical protein n=1 Tax=Streptomyces triculaminicus TaxID=2816232 RepID=UPI00379E28E8